MSPTPNIPHADIPVTTTFPERPAPLPNTSPGFPQLGGTTPGSLIQMKLFDLIDPRITMSGATAWRIRYMSTSAVDMAPVEVSGLVFVPAGDPPDKGWNVIAYDHGNTGIDTDCGPSLYADMLSTWPPVSVLLLNHYVVVVSDYEGLSGSGRHAFLNGPALGRNVIDAVRAATHMRPDISNRWGAFGGSLGGLATWAANEQAPTYGKGLDLVGAATWVPMVDVSELPRKAREGRLTHDQLHLYVLTIMGLKRTTQPDMDVSRFMHGSLYDNRDLLLVCNGPRTRDALDVLAKADPADLIPVDAAAERDMTRWLSDMAVPKQRSAAPLLVIYGSSDQLVDQAWVERALAAGCGMGDTIEWVLRPGQGHSDIDAAMAFPWLIARFDGQKPINKCELAPVAPQPLSAGAPAQG